MDFLNDWGGLISLIGAILSLIGLTAALLAAQRAEKARDAAEKARNETRIALARALTTVELQRAIALVQQIKYLHQEGLWLVSSALYQTLRVMLIDIEVRHPAITSELQRQLQEAILQITEIDNRVNIALGEAAEPTGFQEFAEVLNEIQVNLERMSISIFLPT